MIYDFPESSSPIAQGDIFFSIPILDLPDDELSIVDDAGNVRTLPWETFASEGEPVSSIIAVRPTIAIVGTQECDALRAPNITLFEVRPFRDVERKSKDTSKPSKWVPLITQHARINQKWFYLPADERVGFGEKMGADFLTPIRVPRLILERLAGFRKGRLNEVAKQHFRERLAEFFRRYAYDEWYPLTREELAEYRKTHPDAEPFPWQRENFALRHSEGSEQNELTSISVDHGEKPRSEYKVGLDEAVGDVRDIISQIQVAQENLKYQFKQHSATLKQLDRDLEKEKVGEIYISIASSRNTFSERIESLLPKFEKSIKTLEGSNSTYLLSLSPESGDDVGEVSKSREFLSQLLSALGESKVAFIKSRDTILSSKGTSQNINEKTDIAINRQSQALTNLIFNIEEFESYALKMIFLIDEKFGESPPLEDKAG